MPLSTADLQDITNSVMDAYINKGKSRPQNLVSLPMYEAFKRNAKTFPGGTGIRVNVHDGEGTIPIQGYTADEAVVFHKSNGNLFAQYDWKEMFIGLSVTETELRTAGVTLVETPSSGQKTVQKDGAESVRLGDLIGLKMKNLERSHAFGWDTMLHGDGTANPRLLPGIKAFIKDAPADGTTGGLSRTTYPWWQNRARTVESGGVITSNVANGGELSQTMHEEIRQLRKYANGSENHMAFCGSGFIGKLEREVRANGGYSDNGFNSRKTDIGIRGIVHGGLEFIWDPRMDDLGETNRCYIIDMNAIYIDFMAGERKKKAWPTRPHDRFILYTGYQDCAGMVAECLRTSGVYDVAP